jgi:hypothetical protein
MDWSILVCLGCNDLKIDSDPFIVKDLNTKGEFTWNGSYVHPVVALDGFERTGTEFKLLVRLQPTSEDQDVGERVSVLSHVFLSDILLFRSGSPRKKVEESYNYGQKTGFRSRRHSVYGDDVLPSENEYNTIEWNCGDKGTTISMTYHASTYFDDGGNFAQITITSITLKLGKTQTLQSNLTRQGHKITAMVEYSTQTSPRGFVMGTPCPDIKGKSDLEEIHLKHVYLGRPQSIVTTDEKTNRYYYWESTKDDNSFVGFTPRYQNPAHAKHVMIESQDLKQIRKYRQWKKLEEEHKKNPAKRILSPPGGPGGQYAGLKRVTFTAPSFVKDNDEISNPIKKLPLFTKYTERITLLFFNFKMGFPYGPGFKQISLEWKDFSAAYDRELKKCQENTTGPSSKRTLFKKSPRKLVNPDNVKLERMLDENLKVEITFTLEAEYTQARIKQIILFAKDFNKSLLF